MLLHSKVYNIVDPHIFGHISTLALKTQLVPGLKIYVCQTMVSSFPHLTYQDSLTDQTDGLSAFHTSKIKDGLQEFLMHVFKMCVQAVRRPQLIPSK
jgi:hypothetical protein